MDGTRFDRLTRTLTTTGSRRRALGGLLSGALGVLSSGAEHTTAKKKKPCPPCKKRKQGKCKKKLPDGTACAGGICQNGNCVAQGAGGGSRQPPPPPAGTCIDGVKNGSETGVDCGGECFRCGLGETCASRDDCQNAHCLNGTCQQCTADSQCPDDAHGACVCDIFRVCRQRDGITANNCGECPPDWHSCSPGNPSATCYLRCGVTEPCAPTANYCTSGTERCGDNGHCLQPRSEEHTSELQSPRNL